MNCPHTPCTGRIDTDLIRAHAESYGGSRSIVQCPKCKQGVVVHSSIKVMLATEPYRGPATTGSWGEEIPAFPA